MARTWIESRVTDKRVWTEGLVTLVLDHVPAQQKAGQFAQIALELDGETVQRSYSLASAPGSPLELFVVEVPEGRLSPHLVRLEPGDRVLVGDKCAGMLTLDGVPEAKDLWLFATGTGLAPFLAMLRTDEPWERFENIVIVFGSRYARDLAYREELALLGEHPGAALHLVFCVSREEAPGAYAGRVTQALVDGTLTRRTGLELDPHRSQVMLVGNPAMIEEMTALLDARRLRPHRRRAPGHVHVERYW